VNRSPVTVDVWGAHEGDPEFGTVKVVVPEGAGPGDFVSCDVVGSGATKDQEKRYASSRARAVHA
jgi:hypothetical protein